MSQFFKRRLFSIVLFNSVSAIYPNEAVSMYLLLHSLCPFPTNSWVLLESCGILTPSFYFLTFISFYLLYCKKRPYIHPFRFSHGCHLLSPHCWTHSFALSLTHWCFWHLTHHPRFSTPSLFWGFITNVGDSASILSPMPSSPLVGFSSMLPQSFEVPMPQNLSSSVTELCQLL